MNCCFQHSTKVEQTLQNKCSQFPQDARYCPPFLSHIIVTFSHKRFYISIGNIIWRQSEEIIWTTSGTAMCINYAQRRINKSLNFLWFQLDLISKAKEITKKEVSINYSASMIVVLRHKHENTKSVASTCS